MAKAIVKNGSARRSDSPASTSEFSSRDANSPRTSSDITIDDVRSGPPSRIREVAIAEAVPGGESGTKTDEKWHQDLYPGHTTALVVSTPELMVPSGPSVHKPSESSSLHAGASASPETIPNDIDASSTTAAKRSGEFQRSAQEYETTLAQMQSDYKISEMRRQEETHSFMERIDALQSKLQYLTKEALGAARTALTTAPTGSLERKVAEKDEQIALLMEEGEKLSKTELRHMNTIRSLRSSILDDQKHSAGIKVRLAKAEQEVQNAKERAWRAENAEHRELERSKILSRVAKENDTLKAELDSQRAIAADLSFQLAQATPNASAADGAAQTNALEAERAISAQLRDQLSKVRNEKELSEEKLRSEIRRVTQEAERERDRSRAIETELRREQSVNLHLYLRLPNSTDYL